MISDIEPRAEEKFPEDIWQAAEGIMRSVLSRAEFHSVVRANEAWDKGRSDIAAALMAERTRCARIAETYDDGIDSVLEFEAAVGSRVAAKSIAAAIRAQGREGGTYGSAPSGRTEPVGNAGSTALPVAWRVKDFADGWILCHSLAEAQREAEGAGNRIEALVPA